MKNIIILLLIVTTNFVYSQNISNSNDTSFLYKIVILDNYDVSFNKSDILGENTALICNGPLTNTYGEIVGGYIYNGHQIKPFVPPTLGRTQSKPNGTDVNFNGHNAVYGRSDNGIIGQIENGKMVLIPYYDWANNKTSYDFNWAFQNGRMLVLNGKNIHNSASKKRLNYQTGLGFLPDGRLIYIMIVNGSMNFYEFANMFIKNGCKNAIYLDGNTNLCGWKKEDFDNSSVEDTFGLQGNAMKIHFTR